MAKKRFRIKDRSGNVVDYDVAASSVTLNDGVDVEQKIADIDEEVTDLSETRYRKPVNGVPRTDLDNDVNSSLDKADSAIQGLIVNNDEVVPDSTTKKVRINIPTQVQSDWNESSQSSPAFIKNKPTVVSNVFYEPSTGKIWVSTGSRVTELIDINTFFNSISYNSSNNIISFLNKRGVVVATLDASSFVVDKFVENVTLDSSTNELVITFNTASGKSPIRVPLGSISGQGTVQSVKMNGGTPIQPVNGVIDLGTVITEHQSLSSYATKSYVDQAVQQAEQPETVVINSDGANIVDGHSNSKLTAPSSRLEKELYLNLKALYDNLAGIAFSGTAPQWQTVAAPKYSITAGTLSQVTATYNGTALPATNVNEGEVTIVLTPDSGTALADGDIHITIGGKEVRFTRSGNNVTFVLSGDATVAATAFDGITVNAPAAGSNFTIDKSSVRLNTANETVELTPNEHCSWANPVNVVVTYGVDNITNQCSIVESGGKQVITLPALSDGSKTITVTASAVVNQHITVTFPQDHSHMVIKHGTETLTGDSKTVYEDDLNYAITFEPADGYTWDTAPNISGTALPNSGNVYTLTVDSAGSDITVSATTKPVPITKINLPTIEGVTFKDGSNNVISGQRTISGSPANFTFGIYAADTDASNDNKTYYISSVKAVDHTTQTEIPLTATSNDDGHTVSVGMSGLSGEIDIEVKAFYLFLNRIVNDTTGGLTTQEGWAATDYIDISAYGRYTFHRGLANTDDFTNNDPSLTSARASYIFYNSSKTKQTYLSVGSANEQRRSMITKASAEGIVYVRASIPIKAIGIWFMMDTSEDGQGGFVNEIIGSYKGFNYKGQFDNGIFGKLYGSSNHEFADSAYGYTSEMFEFDPSAEHTYAFKFANPGGVYFLDSEGGYKASYTTQNYWSGTQTGKKPTAPEASKMFISIDNYVDGHYLYDETASKWLFRGFSVNENLYNGNS